MLIYFLDRDEEISFAINEENSNKTKNVLLFLSSVFNKDFDEIKDDIYDDYIFEKDTVIIKLVHFNEEILEVVDMGVDLHIVK